MLTNAQKQTLAAALRADSDPGVIAALGIRDDVFLTAWCNGLTAVDAWRAVASKADLFEAMNVNKFDTITQGKRDAWRLLQDNAPVDIRRQKLRNAVEDVWGAADSIAVLQGLLEKATRAEVYITPNIAANQKTTNTVVGLDRKFVGVVNLTEVSEALNQS